MPFLDWLQRRNDWNLLVTLGTNTCNAKDSIAYMLFLITKGERFKSLMERKLD